MFSFLHAGTGKNIGFSLSAIIREIRGKTYSWLFWFPIILTGRGTMNSLNGFSKTIDLIHRTLDARTVRGTVIANNIANAEVPNFKRQEVNFESELRRALDSEAQKPVVELARTDSRHISNYNPKDYRDVEPRRVLDYLTTTKNNGNNVDAEQELQLWVQNQMMYSLLANSASFHFNQVNSALR
jgi:flagellar basal-body rod protein FlgB